MNSNLTPQAPLAWAPYLITEVIATDETPRTGFVGRAAAMVINGVECIVMAQSDADLAMVGNTLVTPFDTDQVYKATLIQSEGISVIPRDAAQEESVVEYKSNVGIDPSTLPKVAGRVSLLKPLSEEDDIPLGASFCNLRDAGDDWIVDWPNMATTISNMVVPKALCSEPQTDEESKAENMQRFKNAEAKRAAQMLEEEKKATTPRFGSKELAQQPVEDDDEL